MELLRKKGGGVTLMLWLCTGVNLRCEIYNFLKFSRVRFIFRLRRSDEYGGKMRLVWKTGVKLITTKSFPADSPRDYIWICLIFISKNRSLHETSANFANFPVHMKLETIYGLYGWSLSLSSEWQDDKVKGTRLASSSALLQNLVLKTAGLLVACKNS